MCIYSFTQILHEELIMDDFETILRLHLDEARSSRKLRWKQGFETVRSLYVFPLAVSMIPGKLVADQLFSPETEQWKWLAVAYGFLLLLGPFMFRYVRRNKGFKTQQVYYTAALEKTLKDRGMLNAK